MALIDTDKNGLRAGGHRQPGSSEVLLGSSLREHQHHGAHRDAATGGRALSNPRRQLRILKLS